MIYLDNAATSYIKPDCVISATADALVNYSANPGRSGHNKAAQAARLIETARSKLRDYFGLGESGHAVFGYNCTQALNFAILGFSKVGHFITTSYEHNSVLRPLYALQDSGAAYLTVVEPRPDGAIHPSDIIKSVNLNTVMIIINHLSNVNGALAPIKELGEFCRYRNITLLVDAAQSAGHIDINMTRDNIDMLAVAPHKGLHAPQGIGALLLKETVKLKPILFGGTGSQSLSRLQPDSLPESLESGTHATPAIAGLSAAVDWVRANGPARAQKVHELSTRLYYGLRAKNYIKVYTPEHFCHNGVITFNAANLYSATVATLLNRHFDIAVRPGLHCAPLAHKFLGTQESGAVRVSLSADNTPADIQALLDALDIINKNAGAPA